MIERQHAEYCGTCDKNDMRKCIVLFFKLFINFIFIFNSIVHGSTNLGESQSYYKSGVSGPYCPVGDEQHIGVRVTLYFASTSFYPTPVHFFSFYLKGPNFLICRRGLNGNILEP